MENVDYVAKAKILMKRTALTAALVVLPLAAVSSQVAQAAAVLPTGNFSCSPGGAGISGGCPSGAGASQLADPGNGIQGVKLFTGGAVSYFASGGGLSSLTLLTGGILNGTIDV